jgi:hypothetical protein
MRLPVKVTDACSFLTDDWRIRWSYGRFAGSLEV